MRTVGTETEVIAARTAGAQTAEKALYLLRTVADQREPISLVALSRAAGIEKTATHRLVTSLVRYGLLRFDPLSHTYSLGLQLVNLGQRALAQLNVIREAQPYLARLGESSGEAVNLGVFDAGEIVYVAQVPSTESVVIRAQVGSRVPAHCTAMGKVLLACGPGEWMESVLTGHGLPTMTPRTVSEPEAFAAQLAQVRALDYAVDDEEHRAGIRCIAAPVRDYTGAAVAAISIAGPAFRLSHERLDALLDPLLTAARDLSAQLGDRMTMPPTVTIEGAPFRGGK